MVVNGSPNIVFQTVTGLPDLPDFRILRVFPASGFFRISQKTSGFILESLNDSIEIRHFLLLVSWKINRFFYVLLYGKTSLLWTSSGLFKSVHYTEVFVSRGFTASFFFQWNIYFLKIKKKEIDILIGKSNVN